MGSLARGSLHDGANSRLMGEHSSPTSIKAAGLLALNPDISVKGYVAGRTPPRGYVSHDHALGPPGRLASTHQESVEVVMMSRSGVRILGGSGSGRCPTFRPLRPNLGLQC